MQLNNLVRYGPTDGISIRRIGQTLQKKLSIKILCLPFTDTSLLTYVRKCWSKIKHRTAADCLYAMKMRWMTTMNLSKSGKVSRNMQSHEVAILFGCSAFKFNYFEINILFFYPMANRIRLWRIPKLNSVLVRGTSLVCNVHSICIRICENEHEVQQPNGLRASPQSKSRQFRQPPSKNIDINFSLQIQNIASSSINQALESIMKTINLREMRRENGNSALPFSFQLIFSLHAQYSLSYNLR